MIELYSYCTICKKESQMPRWRRPEAGKPLLIGYGCCRTPGAHGLIEWSREATGSGIPGKRHQANVILNTSECAGFCAAARRCTHFELNTIGVAPGARDGRGVCWLFASGGRRVTTACDTTSGHMLCFQAHKDSSQMRQRLLPRARGQKAGETQSMLFAVIAFQKATRRSLLADTFDALGASVPQSEALLVSDSPECATATIAPATLQIANTKASTRQLANGFDGSVGQLWGRAWVRGLRVSIVQVACEPAGNVIGIKAHKTRVWSHARTAGLAPSFIVYLDYDVIATSAKRVSSLAAHLTWLAESAAPPAIALFANRFGGVEPRHSGLLVSWPGAGEACLQEWGQALRGLDRMARDQKSLGKLKCEGGIALLPAGYLGTTRKLKQCKSQHLVLQNTTSCATAFAGYVRREHAFVHFTLNDALAADKRRFGALPQAPTKALFRRLGLARCGGPYATCGATCTPSCPGGMCVT